MGLVTIASAAFSIINLLTKDGSAPASIPRTAPELAALLTQLGTALASVQPDPATGQPMTLQRLQTLISQSDAQSDKIRQNAEDALAENARLARERAAENP